MCEIYWSVCRVWLCWSAYHACNLLVCVMCVKYIGLCVGCGFVGLHIMLVICWSVLCV